MNIKIDPEFRDLIPPLSEVELEQLHINISNRGCLTPLVVWKEEGILLDGHNRYAFCKKCDYDYDVKELKFASREQAKIWVIENQLGRRNISPKLTAIMRGRLYISRKQALSNPKGIGGKSKKIDGSQNDTQQIERRTRDRIAQQTGVSPATIMRDAEFVEALDKLGITTAAIASGKEKRSRSEIIATAMPDKVKPKKTKAPEPEPITEDEDDVECLVVDATGESPWSIMLNLLPKFKTAELQKLHDLLETDFACHAITKHHPIRIQRSRAKGWTLPENAVSVCRPGKWGNPFKIEEQTPGKDSTWAVAEFRRKYENDADYQAAAVRELKGKDLCCYCGPEGPCHADVLLEWANGSTSNERGAS
jgi:hypothetical protein